MSRGYGTVPGLVSIVVVVFNRYDLVIKCFDAIRRNTAMPYDLVVVNNGSDFETSQWLRLNQDRYDFELIDLPENLGYGRGANVGSQVARGEFLCTLNTDTEPRKGWLEALYAEMAPDVGGAAGRLVNPDGSLQHAGVHLFYDARGVLTAENIATEQPAGDVDCQAGTAQLLRADAFREVGMYDPWFRNGYEDVDLCLRLREAGWRLRFTPESTVMHHQHGSGQERWTHTQDNIARLQERWADKG